ncbi:MAG: YjbF family lipoprotein, partial [Pseudomonas sp.]
ATSYDTLRVAILGPEPVVTTDYVNSLNGPALVVNLGQAEALLVQAASNRGLTEWHGLEQMLVTHNGRLVQSAGLPEQADLIATLLPNDPFLGDLRQLPIQPVTRLVDMPQRNLHALPQHAEYRMGPLEGIEIMGSRRMLQRIDEAIRMPGLGLRATNYYWIEPDTGKVVASKQHLAPELPPLFLTEVQPQRTLPASGSQP